MFPFMFGLAQSCPLEEVWSVVSTCISKAATGVTLTRKRRPLTSVLGWE